MQKRKGTRLIDRPEFKSKPKPITFFKNDKVINAVNIMSDNNYGSVVIVDKSNKVIGIVTERDILKKLVKNNLSAKTTNLDLPTTPERGNPPPIPFPMHIMSASV